MDKLTIMSRNGTFVIDSREVAEMTEVRHSDLLEKINGYLMHLLNGNFRPVEFFIKSSYQDSTGRTLPCYLLTRKGCDMVANKMTGEKGVLFTAAYVTKFEEMEKAAPQTQIQILQQAINVLAEQERQITEAKTIALEAKSGLQQARETIDNIKNTLGHRDENWRKWINGTLSKVAQAIGDAEKENYQNIRSESYKLLEERGRCKLDARLMNYRARLIDQGASKTKVQAVCKLDCVEVEPRLKEIYTSIVKELAVKYVA